MATKIDIKHASGLGARQALEGIKTEQEDNVFIWYNLSLSGGLNESDSARLTQSHISKQRAPISNGYASSGSPCGKCTVRRTAPASGAPDGDVMWCNEWKPAGGGGGAGKCSVLDERWRERRLIWWAHF